MPLPPPIRAERISERSSINATFQELGLRFLCRSPDSGLLVVLVELPDDAVSLVGVLFDFAAQFKRLLLNLLKRAALSARAVSPSHFDAPLTANLKLITGTDGATPTNQPLLCSA